VSTHTGDETHVASIVKSQYPAKRVVITGQSADKKKKEDAKKKKAVKEAKVDTVKKLDDEGKEDARNLRKYGTKYSQFFQSVRRRQEHRAKRGVKEDAAFDKVAGDLKKKYGSGVLVGKEKPPAPTEAEKKEYKAHQAKIASQDTRDDLEKSSRGRYSRRHSNAGSD
jgi:hypothetical protein